MSMRHNNAHLDKHCKPVLITWPSSYSGLFAKPEPHSVNPLTNNQYLNHENANAQPDSYFTTIMPCYDFVSLGATAAGSGLLH
jgi:hypothetical protein